VQYFLVVSLVSTPLSGLVYNSVLIDAGDWGSGLVFDTDVCALCYVLIQLHKLQSAVTKGIQDIGETKTSTEAVQQNTL